MTLYLATTAADLERMRRLGRLRSTGCGCRAGVELLVEPPSLKPPALEVLITIDYEPSPAFDDAHRPAVPGRIRVRRALRFGDGVRVLSVVRGTA